jgi:sugar/nucleoside kinase (ribokinase family)
MPQRIGVIGTFIRDTIVMLDGKAVESIGGLYHTIAYLANLVDADTAIQPLCHVGDDFDDTIKKTLTQFKKKIIFNNLLCVRQANTQVKLTYLAPETREEITTPAMPPITALEVAALTGCDTVLVNLITGSDMTLEALKTLRKLTPPPLIYLDLHSLALGIDEAGKRYYRGIPNAPEWVAACDILQMNEREAATLADWATPVGNARAAFDDLVKLGRRLLAENLLACHITLGSAGSLLFYRQDGRVVQEHVPPAAVSPIVDIIGCGDAFGAAFLAYFRKKNFSAAAHFANNVAGLNSTFMGSLTPEIFRRVIKPQLAIEKRALKRLETAA